MTSKTTPIQINISSKSNEITSSQFKQFEDGGILRLFTNDLKTERFKQVEVLSFRKKHKNNNKENIKIYEIYKDNNTYKIEAGLLYVGYINVGKSRLEIGSGYEDAFFKRMLNVANNIYFDNSSGNKGKKEESLSDMQTILEYSFLTSLKHAFVMGVPRSFTKQEHSGLNIKGKINIKKYYKSDIFKADRITYTQKELKEIQPIIDVIYKALSCINIKVKEGVLSSYKKYETVFKQNYSGKPITKYTIDKAERHPVLNNAMYSKYKSVIRWAKIILEHKNLVSGNDDNKQISGFLIDMSELWEIYIHNLMSGELGNDYQVYAQEDLSIYRDTFFRKGMEPDFIIRDNNNNIYVLDTKFKKMDYCYKDVDRSDVFQIHTYGYYYDKVTDENLKLISLIYPAKSDPKPHTKLIDNIFGSNDENTRFAISYMKEGRTYEDIRQNEIEFIERLRNLLV